MEFASGMGRDVCNAKSRWIFCSHLINRELLIPQINRELKRGSKILRRIKLNVLADKMGAQVQIF